MFFRGAADLVLVVHLAFVLFVVLGGLLALRWRRVAWVHVPVALYGATIEFLGFVCPLTPLVYVDDVRQGGIGMLGMVPAQRIIDVRYLTWMEAEARYPGRHPAGVILVRTKRSTPP
jgi:hypothetical protein